MSKKIEETLGEADEFDNPRDIPKPNPLAATRSTIRVDYSKLFHLMNLSDELLRIHNNVAQLASADIIDPHKLQLEVQHWNIIISELQKAVLKMRLLPVQKLFKRFTRIVRDLAKSHGKRVKLQIEGQDTELDKALLDEIGVFLLNLIRNTVEHGIESPDIRRQLSKLPEGTIHLKAYRKGEKVYIELSDDGAGLNLQHIKTMAINAGIITSQQANEMSERELLDLTSELQRQYFNKLGGNFEIQTACHQGTTYKFCFPRLLKEIPSIS